MESPLPKCSFLNFSFALFISKLFIIEDILNFDHGWVRQRPLKFHIRNRRKLFVAASTCRRRKSASTRFFAKKLKSQKLELIFRICFDNPTGEAFMYIMWKNQRCIFILSGLFWQRNRNALCFVRRWPSLGAKFCIPDEFSPNCFPITPPRNGNIGNGYRDLLESGFKVGENSPMPKKIARRNLYMFGTWLGQDQDYLGESPEWLFRCLLLL